MLWAQAPEMTWSIQRSMSFILVWID